MLSRAHSSKQSILLDDIFVSPLLKKSNFTKDFSKEVEVEEIQNEFYENKKILIAGENQSGKTTICKQLFSYLRKNNFVPIYINDSKNKYLGNFESKLEKSFTEQYETEIKFSELDVNKIVPIVDDFHTAKHKEKLVANFSEYLHCILIVDDVFSINLKNESFIDSYFQYKINEFTPSQRYELIKNWVLLADNPWINENEIYQEIDNKTELVDTALGKLIGNGIMPSYPFFILSFISSYDSINKPLDNNITSQGYIYQTLIYLYLRKEGVKNDDIDTYINFLSEFAFYIFESKNKRISAHEFSEYINKYKIKFNLTVSIEDLLRNLQNTNLIGLDDLGDYSFTYPYIYYFFAAKYFADNIKENFRVIENIISNLHIDEFAYIIIFISHHDKNPQVLDEIILNAMTLFEKYPPASLSKEELSFFDSRIDEVVRAVLPAANESAESYRAGELKVKDRIEKEAFSNKYEHVQSEDDNEDDAFAIEMRRSIKTVEVMGIIIKNRAGSLRSEQLETVFREGMHVHLRIISSFIDLIKNEDSQNFIEDFISKRIIKLIDEKETLREKEKLFLDKEKLKKFVQNLFWNINFTIIYTLNSKIIHSLGSNKLTNIVEKVCNAENTPASFIIKHGIFMWYNKNLQIDEIYDRIESDGFSKTTKKIMEYRIVNHCQTHTFKHKEYQKIVDRTKLPSKALLKRK
ncbi:MAG: ATP-binding protein [Spirosomataceae bacterium]